MDIEPLVHKHFQLWKTQLGSKFEDTLRNALTEQAAYYENLVQVVSSKRVPDGYALELEGARLLVKELQHTIAQLTHAVDTDYEQLYREQLERANKLAADMKIYLARAEASEADYARVVGRNRELENEVETAEIVLEHHLYNFPKAPTEFDCLGAMIAELVKQLEAERDAEYNRLNDAVSKWAQRALEAERVPEGYVLVQQSIHPLDCDNGDKVIQLLANAPDAGPFDNPQDFYQFWWQQLLFAAAPAQEKV